MALEGHLDTRRVLNGHSKGNWGLKVFEALGHSKGNWILRHSGHFI